MNHNLRAALVAAVALAIGAAVFARLPDDATARPCIALDVTLHTYDGPIVIDGACVDDLSITSAALRVVAHDTGDGIFRSGFEARP